MTWPTYLARRVPMVAAARNHLPAWPVRKRRGTVNYRPRIACLALSRKPAPTVAEGSIRHMAWPVRNGRILLFTACRQWDGSCFGQEVHQGDLQQAAVVRCGLTKPAEYWAQHAMNDIVDVMNKRCGRNHNVCLHNFMCSVGWEQRI